MAEPSNSGLGSPAALNDADARRWRLRRWNRGFNPVVVAAAILGLAPLTAEDDPTSGPGAAVAVGTWMVFALDFAVRVWLDRRFLSAWKGWLYLAIVVVTFPCTSWSRSSRRPISSPSPGSAGSPCSSSAVSRV